MASYFHVTASANRASITQHGLDWRRMSAAHGIANSPTPEQEGTFLCSAGQVGFFVMMNGGERALDVWVVEGVNADALAESPEGFFYLPGTIAPGRITLVERDIR